MKNLILLFTFFIFSQASAQVVSTKNWTLIHERTASWCPYCGTWGWDMKEQILNKFANENSVFMAVHYSGDLLNPVAEKFGENFVGAGQPLFYVDGFNIGVNSGNISTKISETQAEIDFKKDVSTIAGLGLNAVYDATEKSINVRAKVEFFEDVTGGDYYLGLYLLEDVQNQQASRTGIQTHKNVLRNSFLPNVFDNSIITGPVKLGTTFEMFGDLEGLTAPIEKYKVVGIIWTKVNGKYIFFNANIINSIGTSATDDQKVASFDFTSYQAESGNIIINMTNAPSDGLVQITDLTGKIISTASVNSATNGRLNIAANYAPGVHIITLTSGKNIVSKKISLF